MGHWLYVLNANHNPTTHGTLYGKNVTWFLSAPQFRHSSVNYLFVSERKYSMAFVWLLNVVSLEHRTGVCSTRTYAWISHCTQHLSCIYRWRNTYVRNLFLYGVRDVAWCNRQRGKLKWYRIQTKIFYLLFIPSILLWRVASSGWKQTAICSIHHRQNTVFKTLHYYNEPQKKCHMDIFIYKYFLDMRWDEVMMIAQL